MEKSCLSIRNFYRLAFILLFAVMNLFSFQVRSQCSAGFKDSIVVNNVFFTDTSTGTLNKWHWDFGDGDTSIVQNPIHHYTSQGHYYVCLDISDTLMTCSSSHCDSVFVVCRSAFKYHVVPGEIAHFTDTSFGNVNHWSWDFGDGQTDSMQNPVHTYDTLGTYIVCLTVSDAPLSCLSTLCDTVIMPCSGAFHFSMVIGDTVTFMDMTLGEPAHWHWDFGDGDTSDLQNPVHTYSLDSMYSVCLTWVDSAGTCAGTFCDSVPVGINTGGCSASFTFTNLGFNLVQITNTSAGSLTSYYWDFGDGTTSNAMNPGIHIYPMQDAYTVCLTVMDSTTWCVDTYCIIVDLLTVPPCDAHFSYTLLGNGDVVFTNSSVGAGLITLWNWNYGDSTSTGNTASPSHTYAASGTYNVCLSFTRLQPTPICTSPPFCLPVTIVLDSNVSVMNMHLLQDPELTLAPNPAMEFTEISFNSEHSDQIKLEMTDVLGNSILVLEEVTVDAGKHTLNIRTTSVPAGIYFIRFRNSAGVSIRKLAISK